MKKLVSLLAISFLLGACNHNEVTENQSDKILIVATTSIIKDALDNIVTDDFEVVSLMGIGVDPHVYKPSGKDVKLLKAAQVVVYNGLALEGKMEDVLEKLASEKKVINLSKAIPNERLIDASDIVDVYDPHFWFDLELWAFAVKMLNKELGEQFPDYAQLFGEKAALYVETLMAKDKEIQESIKNWQSEHRYVITAHDALSYYAERYGINIASLQGSSTSAEFGIKDLKEMIEFVIEKNIRVVYPENITNDNALKALINGCKARGHEVELGPGFFSDAIGEAGSGGENLLEMIDFNTQAIVSYK